MPSPAKTAAPKNKTGSKTMSRISKMVDRTTPRRNAAKLSDDASPTYQPGSMTDRLAQLKPGETTTVTERFDFAKIAIQFLGEKVQAYYASKNSWISSKISQLRENSEHKAKQFTIERGKYMSASNDALFVFVTVTRMA